MGKKVPSLKVNMILNAIRGCMSIVFPLITFPYISRVLGVDNIGKYNFATSIVSYFLMISELGIGTYAVREGAPLKDKKDKLQKFSNQMFSINIISTALSFFLLLLAIVFVNKFHDYFLLLIVLSVQIIIKPFSIEWIYSIFEDYVYITIRSIVFQLISLVLLFALVHSEDDLLIYTGITVLSACGTNFFNFIHARKYLKIRFTKGINLRKHIRPILILFAMSVTVVIYVSSDTTILGFICDDYTVGIYSVSVKVYTIIKTLLSSVLVVSIPRLSAQYGNNNLVDFKTTAEDIYKTLLTVIMPAIVGLIILRDHIVYIIGGNSYLEATSSLTLLSIALFCCLAAWFWGQCILVPMKHEKDVFNATVFSAFVNIGLNFLLIPVWKENAAALTTIIAEGCAFVWCRHKGKQYSNIGGFSATLFKVIVGCITICAFGWLTGNCITNRWACIATTIIGSIVIYTLVEIILKNEAVYSILKSVKNRLKINKMN